VSPVNAAAAAADDEDDVASARRLARLGAERRSSSLESPPSVVTSTSSSTAAAASAVDARTRRRPLARDESRIGDASPAVDPTNAPPSATSDAIGYVASRSTGMGGVGR
jgi:hypothetical protein